MHTHNTKSNINLVLHRFYRNISARSALSWRCSRTLRHSAIAASFALTLLILAAIAPIQRKTDLTEAASAYVDSTLTLSVASSAASVDLNVDNANGTFVSSHDSNSNISFDVSTNNYTGYKLSLTGTSDNQTLVNSSNNDYILQSISGSVDEDSFSANTSTAGDNYNGKWGYNLTINNGTTSDYLPSPTTTSATLDETRAANNTANNYQIGIGARADYSQPAGAYTSTYILTTIANNVPYAINYNSNLNGSSDVASSIPSAASSTTSQEYIAVSSNTPSRTGYTFSGWCTNHTTTNPTTTATNGTTTCPTATSGVDIITSGGRFYIDKTTNNTATLYAIWTRKNTTYSLIYNANSGTGAPASQSNTNSNGNHAFTLNTATIPKRTDYTFLGYATNSSATTPTYAYTMGTGTNGAKGTFSPSTVTLTQSSMSSTAESMTLYAVWEKAPVNELKNFTYMQDVTTSACGNTEVGQTATIKDSRDGTSYTIGKLADGNCWLLDNLALDLVANKSKLSSSNTNATDAQLAYLKNGGDTTSDQYAKSGLIDWPDGTSNNYSYSVPYQQTNYKDTTGSGGYAAGKYGVYYNYCAASAGTYCYGNGTSYGRAIGDAIADICPSGWRMPTGGPSGEYQLLYESYGNYYTFVAALRTPLSGSYSNGGTLAQGTNGYYWSTTISDASNMYHLGLGSNVVGLTSKQTRRFGFSVRCLLGKHTFMQDLTSTTIATLLPSEHSTAITYDRRDGQKYTIAKLKDGKYWMTTNLNLAGGTKLYSETSNVPTGYPATGSTAYYTLPNSSTVGFSSDTTAYAWNTGRTDCGNDNSCYSYYSWIAATAGSGAGITTQNANAAYSICPKGWKLPTSRSTAATATSQFYSLAIAYGMSTGSTSQDTTRFYTQAGPGTIPNFLLSGDIHHNSFRDGTYGAYWSSTAYNGTNSYNLRFESDTIAAANYSTRRNGLSVRCIFAN